jgi:hypothetical protein
MKKTMITRLPSVFNDLSPPFLKSKPSMLGEIHVLLKIFIVSLLIFYCNKFI